MGFRFNQSIFAIYSIHMDSLTQITLGAAVGEAVLGKKVGNKALLWGAIAGTIPDLDILTKYFVEPIRAIELHRGFSHSILFCLLLSPILGLLIQKLHPKSNANWKDWAKLIFWGLFTHPILDSFTTWGTQLFWPLELRIAFKNIFVIDPLYTLPFLILLPLVMRLKKNNDKRRIFNLWALGLSSFYMLLTLGVKLYTFQIFTNSLHQQSISYIDIETKPSPFNIILWTVNVKTEESIYIGYYSLLDSNQKIQFTEYKKQINILGPMETEPIVQRLRKISKDWYTIEKRENKIYFNDLRFGQIGINEEHARFAFSYELKYQEDKLIAIENKKRPDQIKPLLNQLWNRIKGN